MKSTKPTPLQFRPHHFMCTLGFEGKGYSNHFVDNYQKIAEHLNNNPEQLIQITEKLDDICSACPHQTSKGQCQKQSFIENLDKAHQQILGFQINQIVSWRFAKQTIRRKMSLEKFHAACHGCEWKSYGICEKALKKLLLID